MYTCNCVFCLSARSWFPRPHLQAPFCLAAVLNTLRHLSTTTSILTDPSQLPKQAAEVVTRISQRAGGVLAALSGHVAAWDAEETLPCPWRGGRTPHLSHFRAS